MNSAAPAVLALGETMGLLVPDGGTGIADAAHLRLDIAGAEANLASHLARSGVAAAWGGAVGDDPLGRRILSTLDERGVDTRWVRVDPDAPTGLFLKDPSPAGSRVYYYRRGSAASRLDAGFAATLPLESVPWVHLTGITPALSAGCSELVDAILDRRAEARLPVSFDVNHRSALWPNAATAASTLLALARRVDLVFVGRDEAESLWGTRTPQEIAELIGTAGTVVVKDDADAAQAFTPSGVVSVTPEPVAVVEPVGAGDAFAAGYLATIDGGGNARAALESAHRHAARALSTTGDY